MAAKSSCGVRMATTDFADALHLTASHEQKKFLTFDARLIRKARGLSSRRVEAP